MGGIRVPGDGAIAPGSAGQGVLDDFRRLREVLARCQGRGAAHGAAEDGFHLLDPFLNGQDHFQTASPKK